MISRCLDCSRFWFLALGLSVFSQLGACTGGPRGARLLQNPTVVVNFQSIAPDEQSFIERGMSTLSNTRTDEGYIVNLTLNPSGYTIDELCKELTRIHNAVTSIQNDRKTEIASHAALHLRLTYVSSKAVSETQALVLIQPIPTNARLFIDTRLPTEPVRAEDGSVLLNTPDARFRAMLPFTYIRSTDRIYFRTMYLGTTRYFYYDLDKQAQEEVSGVSSNADWEFYMKNGRLPPR